MKLYKHIVPVLRSTHVLPLVWLNFSWRGRLVLVTLSYVLGIVGLWFIFPLTYNGASMFLPIVAACWLFRYRGLLASLLLNGLAFQIVYILLLKGMLSDQAFMLGGIIGFLTSLGLGLVVCWLRVAVDLLYVARQRALSAEQERLLAQKAEEVMGKAYEREHTLNILKDQLVLMINHELRTPLTTVKGYLELLTEHEQRLSPVEKNAFVRKANASCIELADLLETTFEAAYLTQQGKPLHLETFSLFDQVYQVIDGLKSTDDEDASRFQIQIPSTLVVRADQQYLRQIVRNLVSNAIKYSPTSRPIIIGASETRNADEEAQAPRLVLWVQDFGRGIPPEEIPLLFGMFVRLRRELNGNIRGLGLGLYISQRLVQAMGGQIEVESSGIDGEGCRFSITLPNRNSSHLVSPLHA